MSEVHFVNPKLVESYQCGVCLETITSPVILTSCNTHIFCAGCIASLMAEEFRNRSMYKCPKCRQSFTPNQVQSVGFVQLQINKLQVYCQNHQNVESCPWKG
eukprot:871136_1